MLGLGRLASCLGKQQKLAHVASKPPEQVTSQESGHPLTQASPSVDDDQDSPDDARPREKTLKRILKGLETEDVGKVVLHGAHGIGKTWIAKEVSKQVISKKIVDVTIWIYTRKINFSDVFHQLAVQDDDCEYNLDNDDFKYVDCTSSESLESLVIPLQQRLMEKKCLLVLDNNGDGDIVGNDDSEDEGVVEDSIDPDVMEKLLHKAEIQCKVLLVASSISDRRTSCVAPNVRSVLMEIKPLTLSESIELLLGTWKENCIQYLSEDDIERIVKRCQNLPAAIMFTSNMLLYAIEKAPTLSDRKMAVREARRDFAHYWMLCQCSGFEKFRNFTVLKCLWLSVNYSRTHGSINYNNLILLWLLNGCFNDTTLDKAYVQCHDILVGFLDAGLLGERECGNVILERSGSKVANYLFSMVRENFEFERSYFPRHISESNYMKRMNGSITTFSKSTEAKSEVNIVTLFIRGNGISKVDQIKMDDPLVFENIQILCISFAELTSTRHICPYLTILILHNCSFVNHANITTITNLTYLLLLDLSHCSSLKIIPKNFLGHFEFLESLNLSGVPIKYFPRPTSRFALSHLDSLFLSRCTELETFPDVSDLGRLRVLDLSGSMFGSLDKTNMCFRGVPDLTVLDLSETNIEDFPMLKSLTEVQNNRSSSNVTSKNFKEENGPCLIQKLDLSNTTKLSKIPPLRNASCLVSLSFKGCCQLRELSPIENAINLRLLDVSDAIELEKINASFEEMKSLQELNLSNTKVETLPPLSGLKRLRKLILEGCKSLKSLPEMNSLNALLLIDIRGCIALESDLDAQFSHVTILKG